LPLCLARAPKQPEPTGQTKRLEWLSSSQVSPEPTKQIPLRLKGTKKHQEKEEIQSYQNFASRIALSPELS
jgi:hypothetical protein